MFDPSDPRAGLTSVATGGTRPPIPYDAATYAQWAGAAPDGEADGARTWYVRGQNFVIAYSELEPGARLARDAQADEYAVLLPDAGTALDVRAGDEERRVDGFSVTFVPPGKSEVVAVRGGAVACLFTVRAEDLVARCPNAGAYATAHADVAPLVPWPAPPSGYRIRSYGLDVPDEPGRFGRIFRCSTFMVNYLDPHDGPRDARRLSPHSHDDFEQCSLAVSGDFVHHLRWPWSTNKALWREDEHVRCPAPSVSVIPPPAIHTTEAIGSGRNQLVDIFCPPRIDFSERPGWVLNADEYPMPL